jgi:hypothetical protein
VAESIIPVASVLPAATIGLGAVPLLGASSDQSVMIQAEFVSALDIASGTQSSGSGTYGSAPVSLRAADEGSRRVIAAVPERRPHLRLRVVRGDDTFAWSSAVDLEAALKDAGIIRGEGNASAAAGGAPPPTRVVSVWLPCDRRIFDTRAYHPAPHPGTGVPMVLCTVSIDTAGTRGDSGAAVGGSAALNAALTGNGLLSIRVDVLREPPVKIENRTGFSITVMSLTRTNALTATTTRASAAGSGSSAPNFAVVHVAPRQNASLLLDGQSSGARSSVLRVFVNDVSEETRQSEVARANERLRRARDRPAIIPPASGATASSTAGGGGGGWGSWWPFGSSGGASNSAAASGRAAAAAGGDGAPKAPQLDPKARRSARLHAVPTALPAELVANGFESVLTEDDYRAGPAFLLDEPAYADITVPSTSPGAAAAAADATAGSSSSSFDAWVPIRGALTVLPSGKKLSANTLVCGLSLEVSDRGDSVTVVVGLDRSLASQRAARASALSASGLRLGLALHADALRFLLLSTIHGESLGYDKPASSRAPAAAKEEKARHRTRRHRRDHQHRHMPDGDCRDAVRHRNLSTGPQRAAPGASERHRPDALPRRSPRRRAAASPAGHRAKAPRRATKARRALRLDRA